VIPGPQSLALQEEGIPSELPRARAGGEQQGVLWEWQCEISESLPPPHRGLIF
jgi:hypothetical protein